MPEASGLHGTENGGVVGIVSKPPLETHSQTRGDRGNRAHGLAPDSISRFAIEPVSALPLMADFVPGSIQVHFSLGNGAD